MSGNKPADDTPKPPENQKYR